MEKPLILILCTGNSCRSQIAEVILREEADNLVTVDSAGIRAGWLRASQSSPSDERAWH